MFSEKDFKMLRKAIHMGLNDTISGIAIIYVIVIFILYLGGVMFRSYDDTDDAANGERSSVALVIDYGTGCEYLQSQLGYLTPRLNKDGVQICGR